MLDVLDMSRLTEPGHVQRRTPGGDALPGHEVTVVTLEGQN